MTTQTKKLIAIFIVMAITMFAVIKANAEIIKIDDKDGLSTYFSTELIDTHIMVVNSKEGIAAMNNVWDKEWANYVFPFKSEKSEIILPVNEASKDILKLLDIYGAVYMVRDDCEGKVVTRFWRDKKGQAYLKMVLWHRL